MCPGTRGVLEEGSGGGVLPRHVCCVQARDKICDPAPRGVLEERVRRGFPSPGRLLCPSTRPAAMSKHETGTVTKPTTSTREGVSEGGSPPGTAAVSKHETGTVTKQTTGALQFMVAFALRGGGGGGATPPRIYLPSLCPGRREVRPRTSTPLTYTITSKMSQGSVSTIQACRAGLS